jgi:hypothetical protein
MLLAIGKMGAKTMKLVKPREYASDAAWKAAFDSDAPDRTCADPATDPHPPRSIEGADFPAAVMTLRQWAHSQPHFADLDFRYREAMRKELADLHAGRQRETLLGDHPLIIIAAGGADPGDNAKLTAEQASILRRQRPLLLFDLLRLSKRSALWLAHGSSHDVHVDDPAIVARAVAHVAAGLPPSAPLQ